MEPILLLFFLGIVGMFGLVFVGGSFCTVSQGTVVVLTRFASWEVIHQRHHRFSDDLDKDPHPVVSSY